jgi:hypothetical protein
MPAKSEKQRRFLNWKFGHAWVKRHHFDNKGKLPKRAHHKRGRKKKRS